MALDYVAPKQASPSGDYQSTGPLTVAIVVMLSLHAAMSLALIFALPTVRTVAIEGRTPDGVLEAVAALAVGFAGIIQIGLFIAVAVCFLVWLWRGYRNLAALGAESLMIPTAKSAVTGWFIPVYNLVHGYRSVKTLYLESQRPAITEAGFALPTRAPVVGWWWAAYLLRGLVDRIAQMTIEHGSYDDAAAWFTASQLLDGAAAVLCAYLVLRIYRRQRDQHQDLVLRASVPQPAATLR